MSTPVRSFVVCGTQRSGTTLLCWALEDTGRLGRPGEYFLDGGPSPLPAGSPFWEDGPVAREHGVTTRQAFLDLVYRLGTTDNGVFGIKLMWNNLSWAIGRLRALPQFRELTDAELLVEVFPDLHVVQIVRQDRLGQAISWAKAAQDGTWVATDSSPASPATPAVYDFDLIRALERLIGEGEAGWRQLFLDLDLRPYVVTYEHLSTEDGYHATLSGVADHLGVELADIRLPRPRSRRQADHTNAEWRQRYLEDAVKLGDLGHVAEGQRGVGSSWRIDR